jgi:hypothetical protein
MARPIKGDDYRKGVAIRLTPSEKELLVKEFGGIQAAIDFLLEKLKRKRDKK